MSKINQLINSWPKGSVKLSLELTKKGYPPDLIKIYVQSGWLEPIGYGVYKLASDSVEWYGGIYALQMQKGSNIHPGGKTALILKGYSHYLSNSINRVDLFGNKAGLLPKWFKDNDWGTQITYMQTKMFDYSNVKYYVSILHKDFELFISSPELAAMEMLSLIPKGQSFDDAAKIMEGLTTLRPQLIQNLLEECNSIKVRRLFLFIAEKHDHEWLKELNLEKIDLGSGKRVIVENGVLDKKYQITIPREYAE
ncbi:MAG: type IV toxin-antitoxin system AbiEi family antitoxin [Bacteroidetes bacterium]|nr:type IV toxin-antitoxin system AbiEi family antitoxin [Bacteroidota bacterium]